VTPENDSIRFTIS